MKELHLPDNIKVHFAGAEVQNHFEAAKIMGVSYYLYTCFPWVSKMVFGKGLGANEECRRVPAYIAQNSLHTIQDSGLFTLLFGALKGKADQKIVWKWYDAMVEFTLNHGQPVTCVEVDCQRLLGVDVAWEFRERLRRDLPTKNRIINVFHLEDGPKGLDRLIEYSDYIAVSVPELRFAHKRDYAAKVAKYIKTRKPSIDIHMLGCTEMPIAKECRFATSCDSTSYTYGGGAMLKVFHEQKFWKAPLFIHGEYQTTFDSNHVALAGLTWSFGLPNGFISFTPQYRYDFGANLHGAQFSNAYLAAWKWVELYGYNHYWYNGSHCFFGEERIHLRITDHFKIGGIFDLTYFGQFAITPYLGLRFDF